MQENKHNVVCSKCKWLMKSVIFCILKWRRRKTILIDENLWVEKISTPWKWFLPVLIISFISFLSSLNTQTIDHRDMKKKLTANESYHRLKNVKIFKRKKIDWRCENSVKCKNWL